MRIRKDHWYLIIQRKSPKIDRNIERYSKEIFQKYTTKIQTIDRINKKIEI